MTCVKKHLIISLLIAAALLVAGCSGSAVHQSGGDETSQSRAGEKHQKSSESPAITYDLRPEEKYLDRNAFALFVEGYLQELNGRLDSAALFYRHAWRFYPESQEIGLSLAEVLYRMRQPEMVLDVIDRLHGKSSRAWELSAAAYYELDEPDSVRMAYQKVIQEDPNNINAYDYLARVYQFENKQDSAMWALENLVRLNPDNFRSWVDLGNLRHQAGDLEGAKAAYRQVLTLDSDRGALVASADLGRIFAQQGNLDSSNVYLRRALGIDPESELVLSLLTANLQHQDSLSEALVYARRLAGLDPANKHVKRQLGALYLDLDSLDQADTVFQSLLADGDSAWFNFYYLSQTQMQRENYSKAAEYLTRATLVNDTSAILWINLGMAHRESGDRAAEINAYRRGLDRISDGSGTVPLLFSLGVAYEQTGQLDSAVQAFEGVLAVDPDNAQALNYLGYTLADRNMRLDYAEDLIARAIALDPQNAAFLDSYGWVYYRQGDFAKAVDYLQQAAALDNDPVIFDHLGDAHEALGEPDQAERWWRRALELDPENQAIREKLSR